MAFPTWAKALTVALFIGVMTAIGWGWRQVVYSLPMVAVDLLLGLVVGLAIGFLLGVRHGEKLERQRLGDL